jgi:PAS domain-containing protein
VTGAGRGELEGTVRVSEIPAKATESEDPSDGARADAAGDSARAVPGGSGGETTGQEADGAVPGLAGDAVGEAPGDAMWQSSPPGSIYDYIKAASFSIGADGLVDQWSLRAEQLFGISAERAVGMDPIEAFVTAGQREFGQRKMAEILDGREWTGLVPFLRRHRGPRRGLCDADHDRAR